MLGGGTYQADIWAFVKDTPVPTAPAVLEVVYRPEVHSCFVAMGPSVVAGFASATSSMDLDRQRS